MHNVAHVRRRSKNGAKNQNRQLRIWSFEIVIIRFFSKKQFEINCQNRMKNNRVMPITNWPTATLERDLLIELEGRALKSQLAYFGPKVGYFDLIF